MQNKKIFGIIGGMGTIATEKFIHMLNAGIDAHKDQDYYNFVLINHASIPDRTAYILNSSKESSPLPDLISDVKKLNDFGVEFIVLLCNTAHYFISELQQYVECPILNMPVEAVSLLKQKYHRAQRVGIIAAEGSIKTKIYEEVLLSYGLTPIIPDILLQEEISKLIYEDLKKDNYLNITSFNRITNELFHCGSDAILIGCTEISAIYFHKEVNTTNIIDAQMALLEKVHYMMRD